MDCEYCDRIVFDDGGCMSQHNILYTHQACPLLILGHLSVKFAPPYYDSHVMQYACPLSSKWYLVPLYLPYLPHSHRRND